jgi:mono/diheme cytochrome c family protein
MPLSRLPILVPALLALNLIGRGDGPAKPTKLDFNRDIRPLLAENCFACHGPDAKKRKGDLRLDANDPTHRSGKILVPGKAGDSELIRRLVTADKGKLMPPAKSGKTMTPAQIALVKRWVDEGATYAEHWAFVAPKRPALPQPKRSDWARNDIDRFIASRLEREGLTPSPEADRATLIRRVSLDLTGLPPTTAEIDAFLADRAAGAYGRVVDRLLSSPRHAEHMARHWLDLARFGDTHGLHLDNYREMWPYRDWVIRAFAENKPFDAFLTEQLAGDLLPGGKLADLVATGFNRAHVTTAEGGSITEEVHVRNVIDRVETVGTVFLGLTVGCARCHDHKYDPVTQKDFYSLSAFFNSVEGSPLDGNASRHPPVLRVPSAEQVAALMELDRIAEATLGEIADHFVRRVWADRPDERFRERLASIATQRTNLEQQIPQTLVFKEMPTPTQAYILKRGEYDQRGEPVGRETPGFLPGLPAKGPKDRLALARWMLAEQNPLTARVAVNRLWQQVFGAGLVRTSEDLGTQGEKSSHPELLDWLAVDFRDNGWDVRRTMRLLVTSATYRQSSKLTPDKLAKDPTNRLLSRGVRYRLDAEAIRDQALAASGLLVERIGGPSVKPPQPDGLWKAVSYVGSNTSRFTADKGHEKVHRRSLYTFWKRTSPPPQMSTFDAPSRESCTPRRERTNTPMQALLLLNDPQYVECSRVLGERAMREGKSDDDRIAWIFRRVTGRAADAKERAELLSALRDLRAEYVRDVDAAKKLVAVGETKADVRLSPSDLAAWTMIASTLLNLDEVVNKG